MKVASAPGGGGNLSSCLAQRLTSRHVTFRACPYNTNERTNERIVSRCNATVAAAAAAAAVGCFIIHSVFVVSRRRPRLVVAVVIHLFLVRLCSYLTGRGRTDGWTDARDDE